MDPLTILAGAASATKIAGGISSLIGKGDGSPAINLKEKLRAVRMRSKEFGFNPLTVLGSGLAHPVAQNRAPPLASFDLLSEGLEGVSDIMTGKAEADRKRQQVADRLAELQVERLEAGGAGDTVLRTRQRQLDPGNGPLVLRNSVPKTGPSNITVSPGAMTGFGGTMLTGVPENADPQSIDPNITYSHTMPPATTYTTSDGHVGTAFKGPDPGEFLMGWLMDRFPSTAAKVQPYAEFLGRGLDAAERLFYPRLRGSLGHMDEAVRKANGGAHPFNR